MAITTTTNSESPVTDTAFETLKTHIGGDLLRPDDAGYDSARQIWNGAIDKRPAAILRCRGVADVIDGVNFARDNNLLLAVRSGGHNVAGTALCDGGIVLDLSGMKGIRVDPSSHTVRIQPGVTNGDFDRDTQAFGLSSTTGIASTTGLAGLTLGGGVGWLMRRFGLTCDNLLSVDVVTADGRFVTSSTTENADLFWGIRGGGGNFGVVTSFEYRLRPLGPTVLAGPILYPAENAREVMRFYRDYMATAPDELTACLNLRAAPAAPWVPEHLHYRTVIAVIVCYAGSIEQGERVLLPLKELGQPLLDLIEPKPYRLHQQMFDASVPFGLQYYWKSHYLGELTDGAIDAMITHGWRSTSPASYTLVFLLGGAIDRIGEDEMACGNRDARHSININGVWTDIAESGEHIRWAREFFDAMTPYSTGGVYVNFLGNEGEERIKSAYGHEKYERLVALKNRYDPTNFFRVNQNIKPTV
jgi:FAD/FMN-containing dehydrogenase